MEKMALRGGAGDDITAEMILDHLFNDKMVWGIPKNTEDIKNKLYHDYGTDVASYEHYTNQLFVNNQVIRRDDKSITIKTYGSGTERIQPITGDNPHIKNIHRYVPFEILINYINSCPAELFKRKIYFNNLQSGSKIIPKNQLVTIISDVKTDRGGRGAMCYIVAGPIYVPSRHLVEPLRDSMIDPILQAISAVNSTYSISDIADKGVSDAEKEFKKNCELTYTKIAHAKLMSDYLLSISDVEGPKELLSEDTITECEKKIVLVNTLAP